jgi:hypothetical protein
VILLMRLMRSLLIVILCVMQNACSERYRRASNSPLRAACRVESLTSSTGVKQELLLDGEDARQVYLSEVVKRDQNIEVLRVVPNQDGWVVMGYVVVKGRRVGTVPALITHRGTIHFNRTTVPHKWERNEDSGR